MGNMKKNYIISIILTAFILVGCGTPSGNTYIAPQQISEPKIADITPTFEKQIERINNCDGANPTYNVSYKTIETQKATFEVSVGAGGLVTGTPVPPVLEVQLEAKITAALAKDYGLTTEKNHDITLENLKGTFLEHTIEWKVTRVKGLIDVVYGDGVAQVAFDKIANVELFNRTSKSLGCDGNSGSIPPTSTASSISGNSESSVYDDFNSSEFDGSFNKMLWFKQSWVPGTVEQHDGMLIVSNGGILTSNAYTNITLSTPLFVEGKIKTDSFKHNSYNRILFVISLGENSWWYGECGISPDSNAYCYDSIAPFKDGHDFQGGNKPIQFNEWHTFRIELQPSTMTVTYYIDGQKTGSHIPVDANILKTAKAEISMGLNDSGDTIGYFDEVRIGSLP